MPTAVGKTVRITSLNPLDMSQERTDEYKNPFSTMLDMVKCYSGIYSEKDINVLHDFLGYSSANKFRISHLDMFHYFVLSMYWNSIDPDYGGKWMEFDKDKLGSLLGDEFFDDYRRSLSGLKEFCKREYPMLDVYSFVRLQAYATTIYPQNDLWDVNHSWTYDDFIKKIYNFGWYETISIVYKSMGIHWFADGGENDPIKYKWACFAVAACKKTGSFEDALLKKDLATIYKELLIAFTIRGTLEKNNEVVEYVQSCITNFDEERINLLINSVRELKEEKEQLTSENRQLDKGIVILREQVRELQRNDDSSDFDKIEEIAYKLNLLSPQTDAMSDKVEQFQAIWDRLDRTTKKDIKMSIAMFEKFDSFDLALFPMIRSLEHEMNQNFFIPFHNSKAYIAIRRPYCNNSYYLKTHDALIKNPRTHPTIGNIPFIGRAMNDRKAQEASNVINAFNTFLGRKKKAFVEICNALDTYRLGTERYRLVDLRNGIAHGDDNITTKIDKECYDDVRKILYEPPTQILIQVIMHSMQTRLSF